MDVLKDAAAVDGMVDRSEKIIAFHFYDLITEVRSFIEHLEAHYELAALGRA